MRMRVEAVLLALVMAAGPATAGAQSLLVRVTDAGTAQPLQGTLVSVGTPTGGVAGSALTNARGQFLFVDVAPGSYHVRAELIGYSTWSGEVTVGAEGATQLDIGLETRAIELEGITAEGEGRCRVRPEAGLTVADVWDEVRKALEAARWTEEKGVYQYRTRQFSRNVEDETGRVSDQQTRSGRAFQRTPFESRPAADLVENGFVQDPDDDPGGAFYYAPDAAVLLSDLFLDSHCMRLRAGDGDEAGLVGLAFEPVGGRRVPDISGTLWVDPGTWRLSHLEFWYVNTRPDIQTHGTGGQVVFRELPDGTWIIPEWRIRMPWLALGRDGRGRETIYQHGFHEEGATVLSVREPGGDVLFTPGTAALEGVLLEKGTGRPVEGVRVSLDGWTQDATTDAQGRFRFTEVPEGDYVVTAGGGTGGAVASVAVELDEGEIASVTLAAEGAFTAPAERCADEMGSRPSGTAVLTGRVTAGDTGDGLEGARVIVDWDDFSSVRPERRVNVRSVASTTGSDGRYLICSVPTARWLRVEARWEGRRTTPDSLRIPLTESGAVHDVTLGQGGGSGGTLAGRVVAWSSGRAVTGALVSVREVGGQAAARARAVESDTHGRFAIPGLGEGSWVVEVSALGFGTVTDTVAASGERADDIVIRLPEEPVELEGVVAETEARVLRLESTGFYERRHEGLGVHLAADEIRPRLPTTVTQLLGETVGIRIGLTSTTTGAREVVVIRNCLPAVFIDGGLARPSSPFRRNPPPGDTPLYLSDLVRPADIAGIEVFRSPAEIPLQYGGSLAGEMGTECGVILVWTH